MEEVAQAAPPIFIHRTLSNRYCDAPAMAKKRDLPYHNPNPNFQQQQRFANPGDNWNPQVWDWDSVRFLAKPLDAEALRLGTSTTEQKKRDDDSGGHGTLKKNNAAGDDDESLRLNLGGGLACVEEPVSRPNKRVRSGSPAAAYPMCQVDNCKEDLSNAKDYHRRHKVCEPHSKSTKALVAKQMQRFCQQCSRLFIFNIFFSTFS